jgi:hypothetical protein
MDDGTYQDGPNVEHLRMQVEQSAASYKPAIKQTVDAGKLGYHLTSIGFNRRQDISVLDNIQFNLIHLFKIYN